MLFGTQEGLRVDICAAVDFLCTQGSDGSYTLRRDIFDTSKELYLEVFPKHELLGWYSTGTSVEAGDVDLHKSISGDELWYLFLNTGSVGSGTLPLTIHALVTPVNAGVPLCTFTPHTLTITSSEMEAITLDHVSTLHSAADSESAMKRQLGNATTAVESLYERIALLTDFLQKTKDGVVPFDHALLRHISSLCARLSSAQDEPHLTHTLHTESSDALLLSLLAGVTKGTTELTEMANKSELAFERRRAQSGHGYPTKY